MHVEFIVIQFQAPTRTGNMGPRICKRHFNTHDIIVKENRTRLKKDVLPKSDKSCDIDNDLIFISTSDGTHFPTNAANVAKDSPYIRRILQDFREETQVILIDLDSKALSIVLGLFYAINIPFNITVIEKVKNALKLFEIDESLVTISNAKETGKEENSTGNISKGKDNHQDEQQPINMIQTGKDIDCPFQDCCMSFKEKRIFLKHLCDYHFKVEIEELMQRRKSDTSCFHQDCQFSTQSSDNRNLRHHIAIKHKYINNFFANKFPESPLIKILKLT